MQNQRTVEDTESDSTVYFVLCNECFWCASIFNEHSIPISCSECGKDLETMSLTANERYTLDIKKNNITLCFN